MEVIYFRREQISFGIFKLHCPITLDFFVQHLKEYFGRKRKNSFTMGISDICAKIVSDNRTNTRICNKSYSPYDYGEHPRSRNAHAVKVFDYEKGRPIVVAHMHGLRDLNGKMDTPERTAQANKFLSIANQMTQKNDALVVCGDFNVEPDSETLRIFGKAGLTELVTTRTTKGTRNSQYKKQSRFADYMLVNENIDVMDFEVVFQPEVSDHCPLILSI